MNARHTGEEPVELSVSNKLVFYHNELSHSMDWKHNSKKDKLRDWTLLKDITLKRKAVKLWEATVSSNAVEEGQ